MGWDDARGLERRASWDGTGGPQDGTGDLRGPETERSGNRVGDHSMAQLA